MREAFLLVSVILFVIEAILWWTPNTTYGGRLTPLGLGFFAASFLSFVGPR